MSQGGSEGSGRPRGLKERGPWTPIPGSTANLATQVPQKEKLGRQNRTRLYMRLPSPTWGKVKVRDTSDPQGWLPERPQPQPAWSWDDRRTSKGDLSFPAHQWKEEPEPETGQLYRINCKCYFSCTVAFGLRLIPVTMFNFPTPNTILAVNNAQCNECLIHFLVLLYKYIPMSHLLWLKRTHTLRCPNKKKEAWQNLNPKVIFYTLLGIERMLDENLLADWWQTPRSSSQLPQTLAINGTHLPTSWLRLGV